MASCGVEGKCPGRGFSTGKRGLEREEGYGFRVGVWESPWLVGRGEVGVIWFRATEDAGGLRVCRGTDYSTRKDPTK